MITKLVKITTSTDLVFVAIGSLICIAMSIIRWWQIPKRNIDKKPKVFYILLIVSLIGTAIADYGLYKLIKEPIASQQTTGVILTVLSLLFAGVIAGFYTFSFGKASESEAVLPNIISITFTFLFFVLFGALSIYVGISDEMANLTAKEYLVPMIMGIILSGNILYDYWDYMWHRN